MTRLPGDIFLPSSPPEYDPIPLPPGITRDPFSSIISPLTPPHGAMMGYFDQSIRMAGSPGARHSPAADATPGMKGPHGKARSSHISSSPSSAAPGLPIPQASQFLSPRLAPATGDHPQYQYQLPQTHQLRAADLSPPAGPASQAQTIRRLIQQNGRIREAWEAERKYLEANRERAEEVYKEERGLMEEERAEWETERDALLRQVAALQQQVNAGLGGDAPLAASNGGRLTNGESFSVSQGLRGGGGGGGNDWDKSADSVFDLKSSGASQVNVPPRHGNAPPLGGSGGVPPVTDTVAHATTPLISYKPRELGGQRQYSTSRFLPPKRSESPQFPHVPTTGLAHPTDPAESAADNKEEDMTPVPTVDVQEIIPTLEGIPIKAAAIQRPTFTDHKLASPPGSNPSSRTPSPPADQSRSRMPRRGSKEKVRNLLAADATDRLTLHAGHTPSHSLSVLPTVTASVVSTASSSSDNSTPTMQPSDGLESDMSAPTEPLVPFSTNEEPRPEQDHPEPTMEATDGDVELKGPLMVRNMPAHDEIFFKRLSDKLEEVSKASAAAAAPAVLKGVQDSSGPSNQEESNNTHKQGGNDGLAESLANKDMSSPRSNDSEEMEVPLKFRRRNNFGAPFGEFR